MSGSGQVSERSQGALGSDEVARFEPNAHAHVMSKEQHLLPQACHGAIRMRQDVIMELGDESVSRQTTIVVEQEL